MRAPVFVLSTAALAAAQSPTFEVATVKKGNGNDGVRGSCHGIDSKYSPREAAEAPPLGRCVITNGRVEHFIAIAWRPQDIQLAKGAPDWTATGFDRFTIEAKAENPSKTNEAQLLQMLQNLLVERFQLKYHQETVEKSGFALMVGKNGPKLKAAAGEEVETSFGDVLKPARGGPINLTVRKYSMAALAGMLTNLGSGPVVDQTRINGEYDFKLSWDESVGPSLTTAVQELGLKLEPMKVPVSVFVIDSAQKPAEN